MSETTGDHAPGIAGGSDGLAPASGSSSAPPWWPLLAPIVASAWVRGLWAPDEPRYAEVAREAYEGASFFVMHLCGALYPDKPPLLYWLAGLCGLLSGWSELWMRLPSIAATAGSAWLVGILARRHLGPREAGWAPVLYLGFAMVAEIGGRLQIDPLLAFLCLAAIAAAPLGPGATERAPERARGRALACGLLAGLAALAKGPVAWLHVGLGLVALRVARGRGAARLGALGWLGSVLLALLPVGLWALAASLVEPALADELFFRQHAGRLGEEAPHAGPVWKHAATLPLLLLPWTMLVLAGLGRAVAGLRAPRGERPGVVFAVLWFLAIFLVFSAIPPKRDLYLLPVYPALAMLGAVELVRAEARGRLAGWIAWSVPPVLALAGLVLVAAPLVLPALGERIPPEIEGLGWRLPLVGACALALGLAMLRAVRRADVAGWARAGAFGTAAVWLALALALYPAIDPIKSNETLARLLAARAERPATIPCVGIQPEGLRFYGERFGGLPTVRDGLEEALERPGDFLAIVRESDMPKLAPEVRARLVELDRRQLGARMALVMGRR